MAFALMSSAISHKLIEYLVENIRCWFSRFDFFYRFVQRIECLFNLFRGWHYFFYFKLFEDFLHLCIIAQKWSIDFRSWLFQFVRATISYSLLIRIPFRNINTITCCEFNSFGCKINTHTDRYILNNENSVLFLAFQREDNISFDIHAFGCIDFCTQNYTQKLILPKISHKILFY